MGNPIMTEERPNDVPKVHAYFILELMICVGLNRCPLVMYRIASNFSKGLSFYELGLKMFAPLKLSY